MGNAWQDFATRTGRSAAFPVERLVSHAEAQIESVSVASDWPTVGKLNSIHHLADGCVELTRGRNDVTPDAKAPHINYPWTSAAPLDETNRRVAVSFAMDFNRSRREPAVPKAAEIRIGAHDLGN